MNKLIISLIVFVSFFINVHTAYACGPFFDSAYLMRSTREQFLSLPEGNFASEIKQILKSYQIDEFKEGASGLTTTEADIKDLDAAFDEYDVDSSLRKDAFVNYFQIRDVISEFLSMYRDVDEYSWYGGRFRSHERYKQTGWLDIGPNFEFADGIPEEFKLYLIGAAAYHNYDFEGAIDIWSEILNLPAENRKFKSVWAAFMIGKASLNNHDAKTAIYHFEMTRDLINEGFKDSLNLQFDSYGWQALAEFEGSEIASSLKHYAMVGDISSLRRIINKILRIDEKEFFEVVQDEIARDILVASQATQFVYWNGHYRDDDNEQQIISNRLLKAIDKLGVKTTVKSADRIAWAYYNRGEFDQARQWIEYAKASSPLARWIDAKLILRDGDIELALKKLQELIPYFEKSDDSLIVCTAYEYCDEAGKDYIAKVIRSEVGVLQLKKQDYIEAMDNFVLGEYWEDVAYLAENVLSANELEDYLKNRINNFNWPELKYFKALEEKEVATYFDALEYLLARRLARNGKWEKALEYMPKKLNVIWHIRTPSGEGYLNHTYENKQISLKETVQELFKQLTTAEDKRIPNKKRAKNYYEAGLCMRFIGMEIVGTELEPDWYVYNGQAAHNGPLAQRFGAYSQERLDQYKDWGGKWGEKYTKELKEDKMAREKKFEEGKDFYFGSKDEKDRAMRSLPNPRLRFHYRFKAADLMWKAAELLPDNNELKAAALWEGGLYLRDRDNIAADKFYKELATTCPGTILGREAGRIHWFPKREWYEKVTSDKK